MKDTTHLPLPRAIGGLVDVVRSPMYATGVGLVQYGALHSEVRPPAKITGAKSSRDQLASSGPRKAATRPPAMTSEMARLRKASLAVSAAAKR